MVKKTIEYANLRNSDNLMQKEIFRQLEDWIEQHKDKLDPYFYNQYKKCDTMARVWEIAFLQHLYSRGFKLAKPSKFDFSVEHKDIKIIIEATAPSLNFQDRAENQANKLLNSIKDKIKDAEKYKIGNPFVVAISCIKANVFPLPDSFKDKCFLLKEISKLFTRSPKLSGVIISFEWPYLFPEIWSKYMLKIHGENDFLLIKNIDAENKIPGGIKFGCKTVLEASEKYFIV